MEKTIYFSEGVKMEGWLLELRSIWALTNQPLKYRTGVTRRGGGWWLGMFNLVQSV